MKRCAVPSPLLLYPTDASLYTGAHRERFDEEGRGRGIQGRRQVFKVEDLSNITRSNLSGATSLTSASALREGGKVKGATASTGALSPRCVGCLLVRGSVLCGTCGLCVCVLLYS